MGRLRNLRKVHPGKGIGGGRGLFRTKSIKLIHGCRSWGKACHLKAWGCCLRLLAQLCRRRGLRTCLGLLAQLCRRRRLRSCLRLLGRFLHDLKRILRSLL